MEPIEVVQSSSWSSSLLTGLKVCKKFQLQKLILIKFSENQFWLAMYYGK